MTNPNEQITFAYTARPALDALDKLAIACLQNPHAIKAIATLQQPLFRSSLEPEDFAAQSTRDFVVHIYPADVLRQFLKTLALIQPADDAAALNFTPGDFVRVPAAPKLGGTDPVVFEALAMIRRILGPHSKIVLEEINATSDRSIIPATADVTARFKVRPFAPL